MITIEEINSAYSRIKSYIVETKIYSSEKLNKNYAANIFLKNEVEQLTGSFKIRGALSALSALKEEGVEGVVAFSSGNHAQGVSKAAQIFDMKSVIVMPKDAPTNKIKKTKSNGAEVILYTRHIESREKIAEKISEKRGYPLVKPFDNEHIIAGQGTFGLEASNYFLSNDVKPDIVLSCTSGGGLVAGTSIAIKHYFPETKIYPVEPDTCNDTQISLQNKTRTKLKNHQSTICDALEVEIPGQITFPINLLNCEEGLTVSDKEVCAAMKYLYEEFNIISEPSGCVGLAAVLSNKIDVSNKNVLVTISGGNVDKRDFERYVNSV